MAESHAQNRVDPQTAAKIGKLVGARYVVAGTFIDFYGDFRVDVRLVNVETGEMRERPNRRRMQRDHMFDIIRSGGALMKDASLPECSGRRPISGMGRQVPTEALTYYSRALLFHDRGQRTERSRMYTAPWAIFPNYTEGAGRPAAGEGVVTDPLPHSPG